MIKEVVLPEIAENIHSGDVVSVLVSEGQSVAKDQPLVEVETEKAAMEIPSPFSGKIVKLMKKQGDKVDVGEAFCTIETAEGEPAGAAAEISANKIRDISAKKIAAQIPEEPSGKTDAQVAAGATKAPEAQSGKPDQFQPVPPEAMGPVIPASPSVRRFAREIGLSLAGASGSGPGGRISIDDVKKLAKRMLSGVQTPQAEPGETGQSLPDFSRWGSVRREPMSKVRIITASGLSASWRTVPQVTQFHEADVTLLEQFIQNHTKEIQKSGGKLTVTAVLVKLVSLALRRFPRFNASVDLAGREIVYKDYVNIGVAVDTDRGLLVPVIKGADKKGIARLAAELGDMADRTREKKIKPDELDGGTFTISNLGGIGGTNFTPIVYWPEVAILGVSRSHVAPVFENEQFVPRKMLPLSLSYDHRVIDGADGIRFLDWIVKAIQDPFSTILEGGLDE